MDEEEPALWPRKTDEADVTIAVSQFLDQIRPAISAVVNGEDFITNWTPDPDSMAPDYAEHLTNLKIPLWENRPRLLLHELGSFQDDELLSNRLQNIFMPGRNTFLVNGSGSGKTRLLYEGLCKDWGFYFTSVVDSSQLASFDIQNAINTRIPEDPGFTEKLPPTSANEHHAACRSNRDVAARNFRQSLLSRLIIFNLFLDVMNETGVDAPNHRPFKMRWLLVQLMPNALALSDSDIFDSLGEFLSLSSDHFLEREIDQAFFEMRRRFISTSPTTTPHVPFFIVLDEAQYAAGKLTNAFRSYTEPSDTPRSIIQEILRVWDQHSLGHGVSIVAAGVGIPNEAADQCMVPPPQRHANYRWCSDTGHFDNQSIHERYILKYLPPNFATTYSGRRLVKRMWYWLQGRHRFTASFLVELIKDGIHRPHGCLNVYVNHFTNFTPSDSVMLVRRETGKDIMIPRLQVGLGFHALTESKEMLVVLQDLVNSVFFRSAAHKRIREHAARYVESGFALFADSEVQTAIIWEPLIVLSATNWIDSNHQSMGEYLAAHPCSPNDSVIYHLLKSTTPSRRLCDIFSFGKTIPSWALMSGTVLALFDDNGENLLYNPVKLGDHLIPCITLGKTAGSAKETLAWLKHQDHVPFCFPHVSMGPSLLFIISLMDGTLIWVALHLQHPHDTSQTSPLDVDGMMRAVTPSFYFTDEDDTASTGSSLVRETRAQLLALPRRRSDAGRYSLLRVIVASTLLNVDHCLSRDPDGDGHPFACLSVPLPQQIRSSISNGDFLRQTIP